MKAIKLLLLLTAALLTASCEVEMCDNDHHSHIAGVRYEFDWSELDALGVEHPEQMGVINYRVVNHWKGLARVNTTTGIGSYMHVDTIPGRDRKTGRDTTAFQVTQGEYRFMTFAYDSTGIDITNVFRYVNSEPLDMGMSDIDIEYKTYAMDDPQLRNKLTGWDDYNGYAGFLQPDLESIVVDTTDVITVASDELKTITLKPQLVSQNVDLYFTILKKQKSGESFTIDSVWAEISGVSRRVSLSNSKLDISRTAKTMFKMDLWPGGEVGTGVAPGDNASNNSKLRCHANFDVTGIVPPSESSAGAGDQAKRDYGPGILQVIIFTTSTQADNEGEPLRKRFQGKVNLYNALKRSPSIVYSEDSSYAMRNGNHCVIDINADIQIDGSKIVSHSNNDGGMTPWDEWQFGDSGEGDIVVEI